MNNTIRKLQQILLITIALLPLNLSADFNSAMTDNESGNFEQAYYEFKKLAEMGEKRSQFNLAVMYIKGQYVQKDENTGYGWMKLSVQTETIDKNLNNVFQTIANSIEDIDKAEAVYNDLAAKYATGRLLETLYPVLQEPKGRFSREASPLKIVEPKWPRKALRQGIQGKVRLGFELDKLGRPRDISIIESFPGDLFDKPAIMAVAKWQFRPPEDEDGNPVSGKLLAYTMEFRLTNTDPLVIKEDVIQKTFKAAEAGSAVAQYKLGFWAKRFKVEQVDNANELFLKAAIQGLPQAQYEVGRSLVYGHGCLAEPEKGIEWLNRAAANGESQSKIMLAGILSRKNDLKSQLQAKEYFGDVDKIPPRSLLAYIWMLIKSPHNEVADPELALSHVKKLGKKQYRDDITLDKIRAAAYAAMGNFKKAISYQEDAIDEAEDRKADTDKLVANFQAYKKKQLWF